MKTCSACGQTLPLSSFPVRKASRDGLGYSCRDCKNAQNKNHYDNNKEDHYARNRRVLAARKARDPAWANAWNVWKKMKEVSA